ncbi:MAG: hypothetical protein ACHQ53_05210 [Polyangiales bacterium]
MADARALPLWHLGATSFGIMICNDIWYLEPARVLAARGAAVIDLRSVQQRPRARLGIG